MNQQKHNQASSPTKLPLKNLQPTPEEISDWKSHPVTRCFFAELGYRYNLYKTELPKVYIQDNAEATHARLAELIGGMRVLRDVLNARNDIINDYLFSLEDLKEVVDEEYIGDTSSTGLGIGFTGRGSDAQGDVNSAS